MHYSLLLPHKLMSIQGSSNIRAKANNNVETNLINSDSLESLTGPSAISFKSSEISKYKTVILADTFDDKNISHGFVISLLLKNIINDANIIEIATQINDKPVDKYEDWLVIKDNKGNYNDICCLTNLFKEIKSNHNAKTVILSRGIDFSFEDFSNFIGIKIDAKNVLEKKEAILKELKRYSEDLDYKSKKLDALEEDLIEIYLKKNNLTKEDLQKDVEHYFKIRNHLFNNQEYTNLNNEVVKGKLYQSLIELENVALFKKVFIAAGNSGKDHFNLMTLAQGVESIAGSDFEYTADNSLVTQKENCTFELYPTLNEKGELGLSLDRSSRPDKLTPFLEDKFGIKSKDLAFYYGIKPEDVLISEDELTGLKDSVAKHYKNGGLSSNIADLYRNNPSLRGKIIPIKDFLELSNDVSTINYWKRNGLLERELQKGDYVLYDPEIKRNYGCIYLLANDGKLTFATNPGLRIAKKTGTSFANPIAAGKYIKAKVEELSGNQKQ